MAIEELNAVDLSASDSPPSGRRFASRQLADYPRWAELCCDQNGNFGPLVDIACSTSTGPPTGSPALGS